jgi:tRNA threonylcarbamoyladenosine biosynthesis protein TsaB
MEFYMFVLALDTTTRRGSVAIARDGLIIDAFAGDPAVTHGQRLPGDLTRMLAQHRLRVGDIDLFAVAAGPGSFTGLRVGIATMQGLALANGKHIVGVSALDALHHAFLSSLSPQPSALTREAATIELAVWMDAQRGEVFSARYVDGAVIDGPSVEKPRDVLSRWGAVNGDRQHPIAFIGEGAVVYRDLIRTELPAAVVANDVPMLAPSIAVLAGEQAQRHETTPPDAIRPLYVRRSDAELARDRKAGR